MKSFYRAWLAMSGGVYRDESYTYGKLTDLQQALDFEFWSDVRSEWRCLLDYGDIPLETFIKGERKKTVNLVPYIWVHGPNGVVLNLKKNGGFKIVKNSVPKWKGMKEEEEAYEAFFAASTPYIDWSAVPLIELEEPILQAGDTVYEDNDPDMEAYIHGCRGEGVEDDEFRERMAELIAVDPKWLKFNAGTIPALAEGMHKTGDYSAMPVLADALQEAGCDNELFLWHCRAPAAIHARGSWLVELLRPQKAAAKKPKKKSKKKDEE